MEKTMKQYLNNHPYAGYVIGGIAGLMLVIHPYIVYMGV